MPAPPRKRPTIAERTDETSDDSAVNEAASMLFEQYPDLDSPVDTEDEDAPRDAFAQKARALFKARMRAK